MKSSARSEVPFFIRTLAAFFGLASACRGQLQTGQGATNAANPHVPTDYAVVARDFNSQVWEGHTYVTNQDGTVYTNTHRYTELCMGMFFMKNGQLTQSVEEIDPAAGGGFQAVQGRHQVQWAANANTPNGAVTLTMANGQQQVSTVYGLAYWDQSSGSNVLIAPLQDCAGTVVASNKLVYSNAFEGVSADLQYVYMKAGLAQDVLIKSLPSPANYGLNPQSTTLEVCKPKRGSSDADQQRKLAQQLCWDCGVFCV